MGNKSSRSKKATVNMVVGFAYEAVALVCGLVLPRLILSAFGSQYNGLTSSISQFISCIALLKAGIGGVSRAALYKPLAENDVKKMSEVVAATEQYLRKIALVFCAFVLGMAVVYPIIINREFPWLFSSSLILIISITTFGQYYFGLTYQNFLIADQKHYIVSAIEIFTTILNTVVAAILIKVGAGIHIVKLGSAAVFLMNPLFMRAYTIRKYHLNVKIKPPKDTLKQKWDAIGHAIATFVNDNTDVMILTIFTTLSEVSVYTVYNYVIVSIKKIVNTFVTGFGAAFGNMYVKNEYDVMEENLCIFETIVFSLVSIIYSVTLVMICPFAIIYTKSIVDTQYFRPLFGILVTLAGACACFRIPYQTIVIAIGHYKQTRNGAFAEAILNIVISVLCVIKFGLIGVAAGTLAAALFRSFQYAIYLSRNVIKRSPMKFISHVLTTSAVIVALYFISKLYPAQESINSVGKWILYSGVSAIISVILTLGVDLIFYRKETFLAIKKVKGIFIKKKAGES